VTLMRAEHPALARKLTLDRFLAMAPTIRANADRSSNLTLMAATPQMRAPSAFIAAK
jgi:hypothetical protein